MIIETAGRTREVLIQYKRVKNMWLRVGEDGSLKITCSRYVTQKQIREFILSREKWIEKTEASMRKKQDTCSWGEGDTAVWMGRTLKVRCAESRTDFMDIEDDTLVFYLRHDTPENRRTVFYRTASRQLVLMIQERRDELDRSVCTAYGKPLPKITVKYMTSRWGSCTPSKAHISISSRLIHFPYQCLEYVLTHEYAHMLVSNHSKQFWHEVEARMPGFRAAERLLKQ